MFKRRISGLDIEVIVMLLDTLNGTGITNFAGSFSLQEIKGLTIQTRALDPSWYNGYVEFEIDAKIKWLRVGGLNVSGAARRNGNVLCPTGNWRIRLGGSTIVLQLSD